MLLHIHVENPVTAQAAQESLLLLQLCYRLQKFQAAGITAIGGLLEVGYE